MAVAVSTLLPQARAELPGIPEPVLTTTLFRVLRKFFWESEAWKYTYDNGLTWAANTLAVPAPTPGTDIPAKTVVKRIDQIKYDAGGDAWDTIIPFKTRDELDRWRPDWRTRVGTTPDYWTHDNDVGAVITPQTATNVTTALLIRAVIAPVYTAVADTLPDPLYYEFEDYMRAGLLAELMKMPGRDWTSPDLSAAYMAMYREGVIKAKSRAEAGFGQPMTVMSYGGL